MYLKDTLISLVNGSEIKVLKLSKCAHTVIKETKNLKCFCACYAVFSVTYLNLKVLYYFDKWIPVMGTM